MFPTISTVWFCIPGCPFSLGGSDEDSMDVNEEDIEQDKKDENAKAHRKKAGLPVLELDALPSSICPKMANLWMIGGICLLFSHLPSGS